MVQNFILNDIILFLFYFIIYFVIPMMLCIDMLLRSYVVIEPYYVLADGTANCVIYFNNSFIVTSKLLSLGQMLSRPILFIIAIMVHDVIEPCGC